ncbi:MAG: type II secretion system protein [bacterium]
MKKENCGFTLIELLIVVAIIAILAAIAIPNFLAAQTRAKVSRAKGEMRTLATALESYYVDNTSWPQDGTDLWGNWPYYWYIPNDVTTPISYISSNKLDDPFRDAKYFGADTVARRYRYWNTSTGILSRSTYTPEYRDAFGGWGIGSAGPDQYYSPDVDGNGTKWGIYNINVPYDPSNGTVSIGDILRSQKHPNNYE